MARNNRIHIAWHSRNGAVSEGWSHPQWGFGYAWDRADVYRDIAQMLERARLDLIVFSDSIEVVDTSPHAAVGRLETTTLAAAIADATTRIGLAPAIDTEFYRPFMTARLVSTLDHLSGGRIGWTIQPVVSDVAKESFGSFLPFPEGRGERLRRAEEFVDVCRHLWDSWEPDAVVGDYRTGAFADPAKVHEIAHAGEFYSSRGPLNTVRPPQGQPVAVMVPADDEFFFAAHHAEVVILQGGSSEDLAAKASKMRKLVAEAGRKPDEVILLVSVSPVIGASEGGADLIEQQISTAYGEPNGSSLRLKGLSEEVCDAVEDLLDKTGADGISIEALWLPNYVATLAAYLVTPLQRRGRLPASYGSEALRDNLALPAPAVMGRS